MAALRRFLLRLLNVVRPGRAEEELARETAAHLALLEEDYRRRGMASDDARFAARRAFGGVAHTNDLQRDARSFAWLDDARRDVQHAARLLGRDPLFALIATLSLAIGIGANTTIFTVANALLFRTPVGVAQPERIVDIGVSRNGNGFNPGSYPNYLDIRRRSTALDGVYAYGIFVQPMSLGNENDAGVERVFGNVVTANYFVVLGAVPAAGRLFGADESEQPGASPIVVLSHRFWTRRFNRDPGVVGQALRLNGRPFTVVGVASEEFQGTRIFGGDVWVPMNMVAAANLGPASSLTDRGPAWLMMGGRLKAGVSLRQASAELETIARALASEYPEQNGGKGLRALTSSPVPGSSGLVAAFVALLMGIVLLVLIVACANVAGVLLARAAARRREIAVRLAMGAGRGRLVRQLLAETMMLFLLGGASGLALARGMTSLLVSRLPALPFPVEASLALDGRAILFTAALSLVAALLSGLAPAVQASKAAVVPALKDRAHGSPGGSRLRNGFVIAQVALSILLVTGAGLFVRALQRAGSIDPGFDPRGVELASLDLSQAGFTDATGSGFARELADRIRALPGVDAASIARVLPGGFEGLGFGLNAPGVVPPNGQRRFDGAGNIVEPGYFATLRIPLVAGRDFSAADRVGAQPVVIVSEAIARQFWPGRPTPDAVGKYLVIQQRGATTALVIGVARDVTSSSLVDGLTPLYVYLPLQQQYTSKLTILARTSRGQRLATEIRALVTSVNPNLPIITAQTLEEYTSIGRAPQQVAASVSGSLGFVGLLLAAIGIYGVTAHTVTRRTREIGIRMALGARRADVVAMVLRQGLRLAVIGSAIGLLLAAGASRVLVGFLFGVPPLDLVIFGGAAALFAVVGLAASYVPARRATRVDPLAALRCE